MSPLVRINALGVLRIALDDTDFVPLAQPRRLALLAYLALAEPRGLHSRDTLLALLWPESSSDQGRHALRSSLHAIRKALGDGVILTAGHSLVGVERARIDCDVDHLLGGLAAGRIAESLAGYADLLAGFHVSGAPEFERWLDDARSSLRRTVVEASLRAAEAHHAAGETSEALRLARDAQRIDPDDERLLRRCLQLSAANGDLAGAHRSYRAFVVRLAREYDAEPAAETAELMTTLSTQFAGRHDSTTRTCIALLPFVDASLGQDATGSCDALWDGISRRLARLPGVHTLARCVVAHCVNGNVSALAAARDLGADILVSGRIGVPAGSDELEVRLEVIDAAEGVLIRDITLRAQRRNLFVLEGPLTSAIAPMVQSNTAAMPGRDPQRQAWDSETFAFYVRGNFLLLCALHVGGKLEDLQASRHWFERALERDPEFAPAYSGLANYFAVCAGRNILQPFAEHFRHAITLSDRALELDATQAIPHVHYGVQAMYLEGDWERAGKEFHRAVALDPTYAEGRRFLGIYLGAMGAHEDSIRELREAARIEPQMAQNRNSLGDALLALGRHHEAIGELRIALKLDAGFRAARERLVRCLERIEQFELAIAERRASAAGERAERFAIAFANDGAEGYRRERKLELRAQIEDLTRRAAVSPANAADLLNPVELSLALALAELGEWDEALRWEGKASVAQSGRRQWFLGRPELQPMHATRPPRKKSTKPVAST